MRRPARHGFVTLPVISLLLCVMVAGVWVRGSYFWRYEGLTYNSKRIADGGQLHFCVAVKPFGVSFSHHRLKVAILDVGWLPFSVRSAQVSPATIRDWYLVRHGGRGTAGIWWLAGSPRDDQNGSVYEIFIPYWALAWLAVML